MSRVQIGKDWRPARFERRTPMEYECLRPEISGDAARLQSALITNSQWIRAQRMDRVIVWCCAAVLGVGLLAAMLGWI